MILIRLIAWAIVFFLKILACFSFGFWFFCLYGIFYRFLTPGKILISVICFLSLELVSYCALKYLVYFNSSKNIKEIWLLSVFLDMFIVSTYYLANIPFEDPVWYFHEKIAVIIALGIFIPSLIFSMIYILKFNSKIKGIFIFEMFLGVCFMLLTLRMVTGGPVRWDSFSLSTFVAACYAACILFPFLYSYTMKVVRLLHFTKPSER